MIWFSLALFVVSFIITALLAPRPDIENARASTLNDVTFPIASENSPLPIVLGRVRHQGPNTLWYGGFRTEEITERIRVSLFKRETIVVGHRYYLTMDMGLGLGPDIRLREVYIDEELVWSGNTGGATTTNISISSPELFGGYKEGGGWVSSGLFYSGAFNQPVDATVEALVGVGRVPAYRGTSHIVFNDAYIGESANLRRIAFVLEQFTNDLLLANGGLVGTDGDINPAEALYQILINDWYGLNVPPTSLNIPSFQAAGATLLAEGNGASILITSESDGKRVVSELLRQMDAIMFQDPTTGEIHLDLIRDDYVIADLPILDEDDIVEVRSFTKTAWDEVFSQTKVQFQQRDSESDAIAISQDMAAFSTLGRLKTQTLSFPFVYNRTLANEIASRERAQSSVPLFRATIEVNRNAYMLRPGSVFVFNFSEYNISQLIMRVQRFDLGSLLEGRMVIEAIQDNFAVEDTVFAQPADSDWANVVYGPVDIVASDLVQTPRFMAAKGVEPIQPNRYGVTPLAARPAPASSSYTMHVQTAGDPTVDDGTTDPINVPYHGSGLLTAEYSRDEGFVTGQDTTVGLALNGVVGNFPSYTTAQIRDEYFGIIRINDEFMAYETATDTGGNNWTLTNVWRGILGTRPQTHAISSRVYSVDSTAFGRGIEDFPPDGSPASIRLLDVSAGITQDPNFQTATAFSVPSQAQNLNASPIRPGNLQLGGMRELTPTIADQVDRPLTWATRSFDGSQIAFETDAAEALPHSESYAVNVLVNGVPSSALSGTVAAGVTTYTVPFSATSIASTDVEIRVTPTDEDSGVTGVEYSWYSLILDQVPEFDVNLFSASAGILYRFEMAQSYTDTGLTIQVVSAGDLIAGVRDLAAPESNATQSASGSRPTWQAGNLARFDGSNDVLLQADTPNAAAGSFAARVRADVGASGTRVIIGAIDAGTFNRGWISVTDGVPSMGIGQIGSNAFQGGEDVRSATAFHTIAGTWDGTTARLYLDGVEVNNTPMSGSPTTLPAHIGARNDQGSGSDLHWDGDLDTSLMIDRALVPTDIANLTAFWEDAPNTLSYFLEGVSGGVSTSSFATKGNVADATQSFAISHVRFFAGSALGTTGEVLVALLDSSTSAVVRVLGRKVYPASVAGWNEVALDSPVVVLNGQRFLVAATRTDGTTGSNQGVNLVAGSLEYDSTVSTYVTLWSSTDVSIQAGDTNTAPTPDIWLVDFKRDAPA